MEIPASVIMSSGMYAYVAVKGSLYALDSAVFGLNPAELSALCQKFPESGSQVINGVTIKTSPVKVINALGELGYKVVSTTGEAEMIWTMQREV